MLWYKQVLSLAVVMMVSPAWMAAERSDEEGGWLMTEDQLETLAYDVCDELYFDTNKIDECQDNFKNSTRKIAPEPSDLQYICRGKTRATYSIEKQSLEKQLVILVPDDASGDICISIFRTSKRSGFISEINNDYNYTFWTTTQYKDGSHSQWRMGPKLPPWNANNINFIVEEPNLEFVENSKRYKAVFEMHVVGETSPCTAFNIRNACKKQDLGSSDEETIRPYLTSNETKILVSINDLPINDKCTLKIYNHDNLGTPCYVKTYMTPVPNNTDLPEQVTNVTLDALAKDEGWDVTVGWARPKRTPVKYQLKLLAPDGLRSVNLSGTESSYTFSDVRGEEGAPYNVTIYSIIHDRKAKKIGLGQFPPRPSFQAVIITGSWSVLLTVAATAVGAMVWWRKRRLAAASKCYFANPEEFKVTKESLMESSLEIGVDSWELNSEKLDLHEVIGEGAFGVVRRGTMAPGDKDVAIKMLKDFPTAEEVRSFRAEMELMKSVGAHPHIVSLVGCCTGRKPLIVAEYCSRGDLLSFLRCSWDVMVSKRNAKYYNNNIEDVDYRNDLFKKINETNSPMVVNRLYDLQSLCDSELTALDLLSFCRQIAMGMEFLASNRVVHRDLAARNVLVTADRTLKIADFGLSRDVYQENQYKQKGNGKMPVKWMALESLTHRIYTTHSDVWSFGVVVWEVVTVGGAPYPDVETARLPRLLKAGYRMPRPNNCSKQLYEVMMSCWRAKPRERPTFTELHQQLDELLDCACADDYLSLELDYEPPPTPKPQRYFRMILSRLVG